MRTAAENDENTRRFQARLKDSDAAVVVVRMWLEARNAKVETVAHSVTPSYGERMGHVDCGDLFMLRGDQRLRLEVKHRKLHFTSVDDYPYPTVFVCAEHAWHNADPKPHVFIIVNRDMTHAGIIKADTFDSWVMENTGDRGYVKYRQNRYACPVEKVSFVCLT